MKTQNLGNEVLFGLNPGNRVVSSFENFGLKTAKEAFFAVFINLSEGEIQQALEHFFRPNTKAEIQDLSQHIQFQDLSKIKQLFELKEAELEMENGFSNAVYSKLALKLL